MKSRQWEASSVFCLRRRAKKEEMWKFRTSQPVTMYSVTGQYRHGPAALRVRGCKDNLDLSAGLIVRQMTFA